MVRICNPDWHYEGEAGGQKLKLLLSYSEFDVNHIRLPEIYPPKSPVDGTLGKKYIPFKNGKKSCFFFNVCVCLSACMSMHHMCQEVMEAEENIGFFCTWSFKTL